MSLERFFADNIHVDGRQAVEVLVDGPDGIVEAFLRLVRSKKPEKAVVEEVRVEEHDSRVMGIEFYYRYLTAMQLAKIATYGRLMLEKQDLTIKVIREENERTRTELKQELSSTREEMKAGFSQVREGIDGVAPKLENTEELLRSRFERLEEEVERIKRALIRAGIEI